MALFGLILVITNNENNEKSINVTETPEQKEEKRIKVLIETIEGVSDATVLVTFQNNDDNTQSVGRFYSSSDLSDYNYVKNGIAISTKGGDNVLLIEKIKSLLCAAYDIKEDMIYICGK